MEEIILKYRKTIIKTLALGLVVAVMAGPIGLFGVVFAQEQNNEDTVEVTATVEAWAELIIDETELTLDPDLIQADGTANVGIASTTFQVGTSNVDGWNLQMQGANNGLLHAEEGNDALIGTVTEREGLVAGDAGYGVNLEAILGTVEEDYEYDGEDENTVGPVNDTATTIMSHNEAHDTEEAGTFHVRAAADSTQEQGDYEDSITLTATTDI